MMAIARREDSHGVGHIAGRWFNDCCPHTDVVENVSTINNKQH